MNDQEKKSISEKVLKQIKSGKTKMRPKVYFVAKTILIVLGILLLSLSLFFLISFIMFSLRSTGVWYLPRFGFPALHTFFFSLPWLLILMGLALIVVLEILVNRFSFSYRRPLVYSLLGVIITVTLGSFLLQRSQMHSVLFRQVRDGRLPLTGQLYRNFGMRKFREVHHGLISEITEDALIIETVRREKLRIIVTSKTRLPSGTGIQQEDVVVVFGKRDDHTVEAIEIQKVDDSLNIFQSPRLRPPGFRR